MFHYFPSIFLENVVSMKLEHETWCPCSPNFIITLVCSISVWDFLILSFCTFSLHSDIVSILLFCNASFYAMVLLLFLLIYHSKHIGTYIYSFLYPMDNSGTEANTVSILLLLLLLVSSINYTLNYKLIRKHSFICHMMQKLLTYLYSGKIKKNLIFMGNVQRL